MGAIKWYLEYEIKKNRPGLLGDIASLLGMLQINILTINGVEEGRRGLLILADSDDQIVRLESILHTMDTIKVIKSRKPELSDLLAVRHGRYIQRNANDEKIFRFVRDELGLLVDFMAELFKQEGHRLVGIRGKPRVGKTESVVAASVCANKRWVFISSTLIKQTVRNQLIKDEYSPEHLFIIDGMVSARNADERHWQLVREIMRLPAVKVVEHPDIFVQNTEYTLNDFDCIIELRHKPEEEIFHRTEGTNQLFSNFEFGGYDF